MNINKMKRRLHQIKCAFTYYMVFVISKLSKNENKYWLIAERGKDARDNGYVFYRYLKKEHPEIPLKYAITKDSPDRNRIDDKDVIEYGSLKHYFFYITSPMLLSTHYQGYSPNFELFSQLDRYGLIRVQGKKILLDHCVRMGKAGCTKDRVKIDMMVCSIQREFDALSRNSGYNPGVLCNIGMPRFDNLYRSIGKPTKRQILFMPTWRVKYTNATEKQFKNDEYFKTCKSILESTKLNDFLEKNDLTFVFYPHIEMQKFIYLFDTQFNRINIKEARTAIVEDLLIESQILITDYSSVFFDFAYMLKPIIYFQFDNEENLMEKDNRWFDFEKDGFGPVCYSIDQLLDYLNTIDLKYTAKKYLLRIEETFGVKDDKNSESVFAAISKLM